MTSVLIREGTCRERETPWKDTGRHRETQGEDRHVSGHVKTEAETAVMLNEQAGLPRARKRQGSLLLQKLQSKHGPADTLNSDF